MRKATAPCSLVHVTALLSLILTILSFMTYTPEALAAASKGRKEYQGRYAINLASYLKPVDPTKVPRLKAFGDYRLYTTTITRKGTVWYRLRIGFFPTKGEARKVMDELAGAYPEAWITKVTFDEKANSPRLALGLPETAETGEAPGRPQEKPAEETEDRIKTYMEEASKAITAGHYTTAVGLYNAVLTSGDRRYVQQAREFLGLAYERGGDLEKARAEYKNYLVLYPEGENSERVRQRLFGVETALAKPKEKLKKARKEKEAVSEVYGSFSQFYNRDENITDLGGNLITRSSVSNDLDFSFRRRTGSYQFSATAIGGYEFDLLDESNSDTRLSRLYLDFLSRAWGLEFRAGRQSQSTGGVLGLFDGASFGYRPFSFFRVNLVAGYPAETSVFDKINTDRYFYGANIDIGTFFRSLDMNIFYIEQMAEGFMDRQAVGGEIRFFHPKASFFTLVDYDLFYDELNTALFTGNLEIFGKTRINTSVDYRKSPTLTTTNALVGQLVDSLTDLNATFTEEEIKGLARDRTGESKSATISINQPLGEKLQISGDVTVSELTGTPASGGVDAVPGTGYEYIYGLQLIGSSLIKTGDIAILGVQYSDTSTTETLSMNLNTRYPITRNWRINPRVRADYSRISTTSAEQLKVRPSLRTDYYWRRLLRIELEGGGEWTYEWAMGQMTTAFDYFVTAGYRLEF